ncbi:PDZ domain-containing protein [Nocardioides sp. Kera G14]|uniref:YlbL family protein n=1 Tax=Nocardioides sp. Kera G14 TaxID=2884264 RepID=UPI001D107F6D|nr:PDZ domain-containing protein [Nocardioides sp. Kera G14]UDY24617.1 PDZ domain-containing protein [Nocardioides sp. Kera G14]
MSQRTLAGLIAVPLVIALLGFVLLKPIPYVVYRPGLTVDVLGENGNKPIIELAGKEYPDTGQLRMVTVSVTSPGTKMHLGELLAAWLDKKAAVYPWSSVYSKGESDTDSRSEGAAEMASSQDIATAIALQETGVKVPQVTTIAGVDKGEPAYGILKAGDIVLSIDGHDASDADAMVKLIRATPAGKSLSMVIKRAGKKQTVTVTPTDHDGVPRIGASVGVGYDLPVDVKVNIDPAIGGPSAGLIFSLAIYDTMTPGSLTGGNRIAGTGEIEPDGSVGAIGGIQQKIAGATRDGAKLFLVPSENCDEAVGAVDAKEHHIRLVKVTTMHDARTSIETWVKNHDATLPTCKAAS